VRLVEDALLGVVEMPGEELQPHGPGGDVRQRDDHVPAVLQERQEPPEHVLRIARVLEHVTEHEQIELAPAEPVERTRLDVGVDDLVEAFARGGDGGRPVLDSDDVRALRLGERAVLSATAAHVEHRARPADRA
jgi:hypothetical protein